MNKRLFVGGLSWDTTDATLAAFFAQAGQVVSAKVITDRYSGRSKGFGFVEMTTDEETAKAVAELNGKTLDGRAINVSEARPQEDRSSQGFRPSGGGGGRDDRRPGQGNFRKNRY